MLKTLVKKQLLELNAFYFQDRKTGKRRSTIGIIGFAVLWIVLFASLGFVFFMMADTMIEPLMTFGLDWMYFTLMGLLATLLGVFGSVFNTYAGLYLAKDNEQLLAMPIRPTHILTARLVGVTVTGLMYESIVLIPTLVARFLYGHLNAGVIIGSLLMCVDVTLIVTILTCLLGWVVALIASHLKGKSWLTVIISLVFFGGYYYLCGNASEFIQTMLTNSAAIGNGIRSWAYPLYMMGCAAEGSVSDMLLVTGLCLLCLCLLWAVLSRTFIRIATRQQETGTRRHARADFSKLRSGSVQTALLAREWSRFSSSATYMLNCGMGLVLIPIITILAVINRGEIVVVLRQLTLMLPGAGSLLALIAAAILCMMVSMVDISAPSVSLEGKSIWVVQTLPIPAWEVLKAKINLHLLLTLPVVLVCGAALGWVIGLSAADMVLALGCAALFSLLNAVGGLALNLKSPNLSWTSEIVPIKQGMSVMLCLLGGWVLVLLLGGLYFLLRNTLTPITFLGVCIALLTLANAAIVLWLKKRGAAIFASL